MAAKVGKRAVAGNRSEWVRWRMGEWAAAFTDVGTQDRGERAGRMVPRLCLGLPRSVHLSIHEPRGPRGSQATPASIPGQLATLVYVNTDGLRLHGCSAQRDTDFPSGMLAALGLVGSQAVPGSSSERLPFNTRATGAGLVPRLRLGLPRSVRLSIHEPRGPRGSQAVPGSISGQLATLVYLNTDGLRLHGCTTRRDTDFSVEGARCARAAWFPDCAWVFLGATALEYTSRKGRSVPTLRLGLPQRSSLRSSM